MTPPSAARGAEEEEGSTEATAVMAASDRTRRRWGPLGIGMVRRSGGDAGRPRSDAGVDAGGDVDVGRPIDNSILCEDHHHRPSFSCIRRRRRQGSMRPSLLLRRLRSRLLGNLDRRASAAAFSASSSPRSVGRAVALCGATAVVGFLILGVTFAPDAILTRPSRTRFVVPEHFANRAHNPSVVLYRPADALVGYGDSSPRYAQIRQSIDAQLPIHDDRTHARLRQLSNPRREPRISYLAEEVGAAEDHEYHEQQQPQPSYGASTHIRRPNVSSYGNVRNCPDTPPDGYPYEWNLVRILLHWNVDDVARDPPTTMYQSICVFDYTIDLHKIRTYRDAELPFVVENDPAVLRTAERWNVPNYLDVLMGTDTRHGCEMSLSNHFLFYRPHSKSRTDADEEDDATSNLWRRTTADVPHGMTYREWRDRADHMEATRRYNRTKDLPHFSLRLTAFGANPMKQMLLRQKKQHQPQAGGGTRRPVFHEPLTEYLFDELPFFQPRDDSLYLVNATAQHGIYCRFGMAGTVADSHFDLGRNAIALLQGHRRYIVSRAEQCHNLALFPKDHPSGRHSKVDWSNPRGDLEKYPEFQHAKGSEIVVRAGQVLWLPSLYFHTIVSLDTTIQCNTRSGDPPSAAETFRKCGF